MNNDRPSYWLFATGVILWILYSAMILYLSGGTTIRIHQHIADPLWSSSNTR